MSDTKEHPPVLGHIQKLAAEEHRLYGHATLTESDAKRLEAIRIELDQCWDLLRQRHALRDAGKNPDDAHVRPPGTVEGYEG